MESGLRSNKGNKTDHAKQVGKLIAERGERRAAAVLSPAALEAAKANLDPALERTPPPESPEPLLRHFGDGLTTAEVAAGLRDLGGLDELRSLFERDRDKIRIVLLLSPT